MNIKHEAPFRLNGIDSWIHCIRMEHTRNIDIKTLNYHYHEYIEILYFLEGEGYVWVNEVCNKFSAHTMIIVNSMKAHYLAFTEHTKYFCIKFSPHILYENEQYFMKFKYALPFVSENIGQYFFDYRETVNTPIHALLSEIMTEWDTMSYGFELVIHANILKLFSIILRSWQKDGSITEAAKLTPEIRTAILYIAKNYNTTTEKDTANACNLSYSYFSHLFKKVLGKSFNDYLLSIKINKSEMLLLSTQKSITEIAQETGFSSTSHFISRFKEQKGITPSKFRKLISSPVSHASKE